MGEISIFTTGEEDLPLKEAFRKIYEKLGANTNRMLQLTASH